MTATYVQPTQAEFEEALGETFQLIELPGVVELVYAKRLRGPVPLSLRVYTSLNPSGLGRECGEDTIRVQLFYRVSKSVPHPNGKGVAPVIKRVGGSKRINRVAGWQQRLRDRIANWEDLLGPQCQQCQSPMVLRKGKRGEFWGCVTYPSCRYTQENTK